MQALVDLGLDEGFRVELVSNTNSHLEIRSAEIVICVNTYGRVTTGLVPAEEDACLEVRVALVEDGAVDVGAVNTTDTPSSEDKTLTACVQGHLHRGGDFSISKAVAGGKGVLVHVASIKIDSGTEHPVLEGEGSSNAGSTIFLDLKVTKELLVLEVTLDCEVQEAVTRGEGQDIATQSNSPTVGAAGSDQAEA